MPSFQRARYLGGVPSLGRKIENTYLWVDREGVHLGMFGKKCAVSWADVTAVEITDDRTAKAPNAILSGARGTMDRTTITISTAAGQQMYQIDRVDAPKVRAVFQPFLLHLRAPSASSPTSVTEQLASLDDLHRSGALTDDEFAAAKARILAG